MIDTQPIPLHVVNHNACILTCKAHDGGRPICRCLYNGRTIQENALANVCPHPREDQFALQVKLQSVPVIQLPAEWSLAGPLLWRELHVWTLTAELIDDAIHFWLKLFVAKIACGDCREHAVKWIDAHPPDFSSRDKLFEWGVNFHNEVNTRLGKPYMSIDVARRIWFAAAVKPVIVTKGCGGCGSK